MAVARDGLNGAAVCPPGARFAATSKTIVVDLPTPHAKRPTPSRLATLTATVTANVYLLLATTLMASLALLLAWLPRRSAIFFFLSRLWSRGLLRASGVRLEREFLQPLDDAASYVFMVNHESLLDIPALLATLPAETRFLAKRSLFQIPIFGWSLKIGGFVTIDRKDLSRAKSSFGDAVAIAAGHSLLVFPEGTRSADGTLGPFQRGGFLLALKSGLPIVPVGIDGSHEVQSKGSRIVRPGVVSVRYGRPIDVGEYGVRRRGELTSAVRERIAALAGQAVDGDGAAAVPATGG